MCVKSYWLVFRKYLNRESSEYCRYKFIQIITIAINALIVIMMFLFTDNLPTSRIFIIPVVPRRN